MSGSTSPASLIIFRCIERTNNEVPRRSIGLDLTLDDFQKVSDQVPFLADLKPSGKYVMEDIHKVFFFYLFFYFIFLLALSACCFCKLYQDFFCEYNPFKWFLSYLLSFSLFVDVPFLDRLEEHLQSFGTFWSMDF